MKRILLDLSAFEIFEICLASKYRAFDLIVRFGIAAREPMSEDEISLAAKLSSLVVKVFDIGNRKIEYLFVGKEVAFNDWAFCRDPYFWFILPFLCVFEPKLIAQEGYLIFVEDNTF